MCKETLKEAVTLAGLEVTSVFVPFSNSRNAQEKHPSLNWKVTIRKDGRDILTTDYMAGCGHCPSYKQGRMTVYQDNAVRLECERGKPSVITSVGVHTATGKPFIEPEALDVIHSLFTDADAINHGSFEEWADNFGYDTDSRTAEKTYQACLEIGLKLRAALGETLFNTVREACQDY